MPSKIEILEKLERGAERYSTDPLVNQCVKCLERGDDPIKVIDSLIFIINEKQQAIQELMENGGVKYVIPVDSIDPKVLEEIRSKTNNTTPHSNLSKQ